MQSCSSSKLGQYLFPVQPCKRDYSLSLCSQHFDSHKFCCRGRKCSSRPALLAPSTPAEGMDPSSGGLPRFLEILGSPSCGYFHDLKNSEAPSIKLICTRPWGSCDSCSSLGLDGNRCLRLFPRSKFWEKSYASSRPHKGRG